jgi:hypothetical protein
MPATGIQARPGTDAPHVLPGPSRFLAVPWPPAGVPGARTHPAQVRGHAAITVVVAEAAGPRTGPTIRYKQRPAAGVQWSCLVWLTGLTALGLAVFAVPRRTSNLQALVVSGFSFWLTSVSLILATLNVLPSVFVAGAVGAMMTGIAAVASGNFLSAKQQDRRRVRSLPDPPASTPRATAPSGI